MKQSKGLFVQLMKWERIIIIFYKFICTSGVTEAYLILLLLLVGGVELNPGPVSITWITCKQMFNRKSRLNHHQAKATTIACDHCNILFWNSVTSIQNDRTQWRRNRGHSTTGRNHRIDEHLDMSWYAKTTEYEETVNEHYSKTKIKELEKN